MEYSMIVWIGITGIGSVCCLGLFLYGHYQTNKVLDRLDNMISSALDGTFLEQNYDETKLSMIETKMKQYLDKAIGNVNQMQKEKQNTNQLISDISHQIKTPMANIILYSQLLLEQSLSNDIKQYMNQMVNQIEKLSFLMESFIKMSRLEYGIIKITAKENNIQELIEQVIKQIQPKAKEKQLVIIKKIKEENETVLFDMKWTIEALFNIIDNAVKYSFPNQKIIIRAMPYELFYRIDICNKGVGIEKEELNQIFKRFYRSNQVKEEEGVGLGLYLSRKIIMAQGGYIKVKSEKEKDGRETVFSIFLPMQIPEMKIKYKSK